jgi:dihydrofolate synthase/folylpolyglutamate synthase
MGLERITRVKEALQLNFKALVFTVGGTNGKGSTCALLESVLLAASYKVGCHTSPHLLSFNERARVNGENVSDALLLEHFRLVELARASLPNQPTLTYFEFTTLAILYYPMTGPLALRLCCGPCGSLLCQIQSRTGDGCCIG